MNETQNALFDFAFKHALRDLDELFDLAQGQGEFDAVSRKEKGAEGGTAPGNTNVGGS